MVEGPDQERTRRRLCLSLLGGVRVTLDGVALSGFVTLKSQALLYYIAMAERPQSREALAGLLWADSPEDQARASLRQVLSNLQKLVGPFLHVTRQYVEFDRDSSHWLDVHAFMSAAQKGLSGAVGAHRHLVMAAGLYVGDFLAGFEVRDAPEYEEWVTAQRERLRQVAYRDLEHLAQHHSRRGDYAVASDYLSRLLELDPWREDAHRQQMRVLACMGRRDAALSQYLTLRRVLRTDLNEEPTPETTALYQQIYTHTVEHPAPLPARHNLPTPPTPLFGRHVELAQLTTLLADRDRRLITLVGTGGIGKTRLALGAAEDLVDDVADGVFFVSLASIQDSDLVAGAIARACAIEVGSDQSVIEQLARWLSSRQILLVLDNFEHLRPAAPLVADLLATCPRLRVLATSRAPLHVRGERVFSVSPLPLPDSRNAETVDSLQNYASCELFLECAQAIRTEFGLVAGNAATIAEICRRLDGLPLAIELAAALIRLLPPAALLERLDRRLAVLTDGAGDLPLRHRTLRATIDWSCTLLREPERQLFRRLAVFVGGATLDGIAAVCAPLHPTGTAEGVNSDIVWVLGSLIDQSLVLREEGSGVEVRFGMLETIREYAAELLLESGEQEDIERRYSEYYSALAEAADLTGPAQTEWLNRLDAEYNNIRAVLAWLHEHDEGELGLRLAGALWRFWYIRGYLAEGRRWLEDALAANAGGETLARARALTGAGSLARYQGEYQQSELFHTEALDLSRKLGDARGIAASLNDLAAVMLELGEWSQAARLWKQSLSHYRQAGDQRGAGIVLGNLGEFALLTGDNRRAQALYKESLERRREIGDSRGIAVALNNLGGVLHRLGNNDLAAEQFKESLRICRELGEHRVLIRCLEALAMVAVGQQRRSRAARLWGAAAALRETAGMPVPAIDLPRYEREVQQAKVEADDREWEMAWKQGALMGPEKAVTYALSPAEHVGEIFKDS